MKTQIGLSERGLIARVKVSEIKREYIILQRQALDFRTALYRAEQNRLNTEQRLIDARSNAEATAWDRMRAIEIEIGRDDIRLGTTAEDLAVIKSEMTTVKDMFGRVPVYTLLRPKGDAYASSRVDEKTKLERGDILRVEYQTVAAGK